ncbi:hypothetical protein [Rhizobium grahamii]|uniref:hypothetical protein n=1 Tax=Rhizobium grahamii TaxID=1120045 RepID=UPI001FCB4E46|nr:hypothetical protein [Rhizobium grahamii]
MNFVRAVPEQDDIIVAHYLAIWESYGTPRENLRPNPRAIVLDFLQTGREQFELASFIALSTT